MDLVFHPPPLFLDIGAKIGKKKGETRILLNKGYLIYITQEIINLLGYGRHFLNKIVYNPAEFCCEGTGAFDKRQVSAGVFFKLMR